MLIWIILLNLHLETLDLKESIIMFSFLSTNKTNKVIMDVVCKIINIQLEIEQCHSNIHEHTFKKHIYYLKSHDKKIHKVNKRMANVLFNLNNVMCHAFAKIRHTCLQL